MTRLKSWLAHLVVVTILLTVAAIAHVGDALRRLLGRKHNPRCAACWSPARFTMSAGTVRTCPR
jgi:hypothetical protein